MKQGGPWTGKGAGKCKALHIHSGLCSRHGEQEEQQQVGGRLKKKKNVEGLVACKTGLVSSFLAVSGVRSPQYVQPPYIF